MAAGAAPAGLFPHISYIKLNGRRWRDVRVGAVLRSDAVLWTVRYTYSGSIVDDPSISYSSGTHRRCACGSAEGGWRAPPVDARDS
jgi:hypothetical protein